MATYKNTEPYLTYLFYLIFLLSHSL